MSNDPYSDDTEWLMIESWVDGVKILNDKINEILENAKTEINELLKRNPDFETAPSAFMAAAGTLDEFVRDNIDAMEYNPDHRAFIGAAQWFAEKNANTYGYLELMPK